MRSPFQFGKVVTGDTFTNRSKEIQHLHPVSNAGQAQETTVNQKVILNGSASSDPDNDTLSYLWKLTTKPIGSKVMITDANKSIASFIADVAGEYIAELSVRDGYAAPQI